MKDFLGSWLTGIINRRLDSDRFGRAYGWWLLVDDQIIGELEYVRWDESSQFWHEYKIHLFDKKYESIIDSSDDWLSYQVSLQNRNSKYREIHTNFIPAVRDDRLVAIRGL